MLPFADITSDSPEISVDKENPYLEDFVTFTCDKGTVEGNPAVSRVGWYKDNHPTNWSVTSFTIKRKVTLEDTGIYTCLVGNIIGFSGFSNTVYINVSSVVSKYKNPANLQENHAMFYTKIMEDAINCSGKKAGLLPAR